MSTKELSTAVASERAVRRVERKVVKKTMHMIERGVLDAAAIDNDGLPVGEAGQEVVKDPRRLRVARDLRESKRNAPLYIDVAMRRLEQAEKLDALQDHGAMVQLNVGTVNIVQAPPQYQTIDVTATPAERK